MTAFERFTQSAYNFMKYFRHQYPEPERRKEEHRDLKASGSQIQQLQQLLVTYRAEQGWSCPHFLFPTFYFPQKRAQSVSCE